MSFPSRKEDEENNDRQDLLEDPEQGETHEIIESNEHTFKEEYDSFVRPCDVFLSASPVDSSSTGSTMKNDSDIDSNSDSLALMHWAVIFDFKNRWIKYEMANANSKIIPIWTDLGQRPKNMGTLIGMLDDYSPQMIREKAKRIEINYKPYHIIYENCQEWIKKLLATLDSKLIEALKHLKITSVKDHSSTRIKAIASCCKSCACCKGFSTN